MGSKVAFLLSLVMMLCPGLAKPQVTYERVLEAAKEPQNWLTYSGNYAGWRYSKLDQINTHNVESLKAEWVLQTGALGSFETTPLVVDGVLYGTAPENRAFAADARTGRAIWRYQRRLPERVLACCGLVNRGFAILGNKVFMATLDAHVVALDTKTGNVIWDVEAADYRQANVFTVAPLLVKDKVIVGVSGGEYGIRGFIDAYEAETGKRAWRFYTVPGPGEPGIETWQGDSWKTGGAPAWITGSYDPDLNLIYWPTGNPSPDFYGVDRKGDNLFSNCMLALDADTGKLKWYFQFTPNDVHDYDATEIPVLLDLKLNGEPRELLAQANRNGFFYVLDRTNGKFLFAKPFAHSLTWAKEIGPDGRPVLVPKTEPTSEGTQACPGAIGATNWWSPSYSPQTGLFYVAAREECDVFIIPTSSPQFREGQIFWGSTYAQASNQSNSGALRALDPHSGEVTWEFKYFSAPNAGVLSTAGGLVFAGDNEGNILALDAKTGKPLWHFQTGAGIYGSPMTYAAGGKQYVVIPAGVGLFAFALPDSDLRKATRATR
jgi:alcohol dehydrogenase (cytochrome c)